jgi:hypothetical protein
VDEHEAQIVGVEGTGGPFAMSSSTSALQFADLFMEADLSVKPLLPQTTKRKTPPCAKF